MNPKDPFFAEMSCSYPDDSLPDVSNGSLEINGGIKQGIKKQVGSNKKKSPYQVLSLAHFSSVGLLQQKIVVKQCALIKTHSRFASVFLLVLCHIRSKFGAADGVLVYISISERSTRGTVEGPGRLPCQLKKPFRSPRLRPGSGLEEQKGNIST